jgi:cobalt-zinc-cadmium efflux system outer membrane protein
LARFSVESRWREAQVRLAESQRRANPRLSAGLRRVEASDDFAIVAGLSIPLPLHDQNQGGIREARERRAQLESSSEAARLQMRATLFDVYQEMLHARTAITALQQEIVPFAEETHALTERGYREGRFSLLELLDAQNALIGLRRDVVANATLYHLHVIDLERLLGEPLDRSTLLP